ncbi:Laccase-2 [Lachnellula arida]|uniref:laccase n=1 Tax=Lachnellula arida TaxID=1316785 RepID=A0A8T9BK80_9HELO|nr:Laccase-2 [Lachnellula arida]
MKLPVALVLLAAVLPSTTAFHLGSGHQKFYDIERRNDKGSTSLDKRTSCENSASNRACWGNYSIDDDWYTTIPDTGVTREYWLVAQNTTLAPDGYERYTMNFNGSIPGPTISADWGDNVIVHVTNNLQNNGTALHMHGIRQQNNTQYDGVPGATQCPIAPGATFTYKFRATQYGTTWYHSHYSLQYSDGLLGAIIIDGPASANYDVDLGPMLISDWFHESVASLWDYARIGIPPVAENGLINGTNTFDCSDSNSSACLGTGVRNEIVVEKNTTYRLRLINTAIEGYIRFKIDGHSFSVIAMDLVPIVPYDTDSIVIANGERYDIVFTANATDDNYWLRAIYNSDCGTYNAYDANIKGIVRYNASSTDDPTTTTQNYTAQCYDEDYSNLVPYVSQTVGSAATEFSTELNYTYNDDIWRWTINSSSLIVNWSEPTIVQFYEADGAADLSWSTDANVWEIPNASEWVYFILHDESTSDLGHPMHLHGHDFFILDSGNGTFDESTLSSLNLINPPRRDTAVLPGDGYLVIAFRINNPGAWLMHCHIAWHASEGMGIQFLEQADILLDTLDNYDQIETGCKSWDEYALPGITTQDDAGI